MYLHGADDKLYSETAYTYKAKKVGDNLVPTIEPPSPPPPPQKSSSSKFSTDLKDANLCHVL